MQTVERMIEHVERERERDYSTHTISRKSSSTNRLALLLRPAT